MFEKIKHAVERVTKPSAHRSEEDAEITRVMWDYRIKQLRGRFGGCVLYNTEYVTEEEKPAIEEKNRFATERQKSIVYKQSDVELSRHINFNE
jgi:hypothetical protein